MAKADRPWWIGKGPGPDYTGLGPGAARPGHRAREPRTAAPRWPLGTHAGELCNRDRALLFEDPTGVRVLYDPGQSLTGADDPRLGAVHVVLLNHAHADHIGDAKLTAVGAGTCAQPALAPAGANSLTAEIIAAKHSAIMMVRELGVFVGKRVGNIVGQARGVDITVVQAAHASNPPRSEMKSVVRDFHAAVIATHTNEAVTSGGKLLPETRTSAFIGLVEGRPVYPALSGRTMAFDGRARCVSGCPPLQDRVREAPR